MIVTLPLKVVKEHLYNKLWTIETVDDVETQKITMPDGTEWFCWFDPQDYVVQLIEEFTSSVETAMTGGKKNYY